jgi:hypothetical protein
MKINKNKIVMRLIISPIAFLFIFTWNILSAFKMFYLWLKNGGEYYAYSDNDKETIHGIYQIIGKSHVIKPDKK